MTTATAFLTVDETLKRLTDAGLTDAGLTPKPEVTVGPLDRGDEGPRLNWFLYQISPHPSFRNMEHPRTGPQDRRGAPPLAVELRYLLTAYGAAPTTGGDQEQIIHVALAAVMRRLQESAIVGEGSPFLPTPAPTLVEPLRLTLDTLDLDSASKVWTAATRPWRLSVSYRVSLVVVEQQLTAVTGPPVTSHRVVVSASPGPRLGRPRPDRIGGDATVTVSVSGTAAGSQFLLAPVPGDPAGAPAAGWPMTVVSETGGIVTLRLPRHDLAAGGRRLDVTALVEGLPAGRDGVALTVMPVVTVPPATIVAGSTVTLPTAHTGADTELFFDGEPVPTTAVTATSVRFDVPAAPGERRIALRSARVTGEPVTVAVTP